MNEKMQELNKLYRSWYELVSEKNSFAFGEEDISLDEFAELARNTYDFIKSVKENYIFKGVMPEASEALRYLQLLSLIAQYKPYDNMEDESEDRAFTVTCLIAMGLEEFACQYLTAEESSGELSWSRMDFPYDDDTTDEELNSQYTYNVYDADFSEVLDLANSL